MDRLLSGRRVWYEVPERKPHPAALHDALGRLRQEASSAVYIGDTVEDVRMGKAAGVMTIALSGGFGSRESLEQASPDLLLDNLSDLLHLF